VTVRVDQDEARGSGLLLDSVIMTDNLATVRYSEIDRVIGSLPEMSEVDAAIRATLAV
jgi:mRNA-degrading endonuclease toxin of MazEF toxin-antitoxin module